MADQSSAVTVAYVHNDQVAYSWHHCLIQMLVADLGNQQRIRRGGFIAMGCNAGQLVESRNQAVRHFLADHKADWLLWLDTDMGFLPDVVERLLEAADPLKRPIVGALCFSQRQIAPDDYGGRHTMATPTIFDWAAHGDLEGFDIRYDYPPAALVRCDGTGSACVLIHRSVFERVQDRYGPAWYDRIAAREGAVGEDLSFCMRATAVGCPIHVHTGVRTTHLKPIWLAESDFLEQSSVPPAAEEVAVIVPVLGRPEHAEPFMRSLRASTGLATVYAVHDRDDEDTAAAWKQAGAIPLDLDNHLSVATGQPFVGRGRPGSFAEKANVGYRYSDEPWLFLIGSDVRFHAGWLDHAQAAAGTGMHVVGTNDMANPRVMAGEHATHLLIRRAYVDEQGASWDGPGVVCHEGYRHWYVDDEIVQAAKQRGVWTMALASKVEHLHPLFGRAEMDPVYALGQAHMPVDKQHWEERLLASAPEVASR